MTEDPPVTAELPDAPVHTTGLDHVTIIGSSVEDTIAFYRDLLGMPLVLRQPNLDAPDVTHLFFDAGDGRILTFFVSEDRDSNRQPHRTPLGGVHHIALSVAPDRFGEVKAALADAGYRYNEFDRGIFHSLYTRDHNGLVIELSTDTFDVPDDRRGEVLARAQAKRIEAGADYAMEEHLEAALEELGLPTDRADIGEAPSGAGGLE